MAYCKAKYRIGGELVACKREAEDSEYCILCDPNPQKDHERFFKIIENILNNESALEFDLRGIQFFEFRKNIFRRNTEKKLILDGSTFCCEVNIDQMEIRQPISFKNVVFKKKFSYKDLKFSVGHEFNNIEFEGPVDLINIVFKSNVGFQKITFHNACHFDNVRAECKSLLIQQTNFQGGVTFERLYINGGCRIEHSSFKQGAFFQDYCQFIGGFSLVDIVFDKEVHFTNIFSTCGFFIDNVRFNDSTNFISVDLPNDSISEFKDTIFNGKADLSGIKDNPHSSIRFLKCNLAGLNIRTIPFIEDGAEFVDCRWRRNRAYSFFRRKIQDENEKPRDKKLVQIYRRLHKYYYELSEFDTASDFYVGFQISKRKCGSINPLKKFLSGFYSIFSKYGESFMRPMFALLIIWSIVPLILLYIGVGLDNQSNNLTKYSFYLDGSFLPLTSDYWKAVLYNISLSTIFRSSEMAPPITSWQHFIILIEMLLNGLFVTFIIIGIRRQFVPKRPIV